MMQSMLKGTLNIAFKALMLIGSFQLPSFAAEVSQPDKNRTVLDYQNMVMNRRGPYTEEEVQDLTAIVQDLRAIEKGELKEENLLTLDFSPAPRGTPDNDRMKASNTKVAALNIWIFKNNLQNLAKVKTEKYAYGNLNKIDPNRNSVEMNISVVNADTINAAVDLYTKYKNISRHKKIAAVSFGSEKHPGGGFITGELAQEEEIARVTNIFATLRGQGLYPIKPGELIISDAQIFRYGRDDKFAMRDDFIPVRIITSPAPNLNPSMTGNELKNFDIDIAEFAAAAKIEKFSPKNLKNLNFNEVKTKLIDPINLRLKDNKRYRNNIKERVRAIFRAAGDVDVLVFGAYGCGIFNNEPNLMAQLIRKVLEEDEFKKASFSELQFAILAKNETTDANFQAFKNEFDK